MVKLEDDFPFPRGAVYSQVLGNLPGVYMTWPYSWKPTFGTLMFRGGYHPDFWGWTPIFFHGFWGPRDYTIHCTSAYTYFCEFYIGLNCEFRIFRCCYYVVDEWYKVSRQFWTYLWDIHIYIYLYNDRSYLYNNWRFVSDQICFSWRSCWWRHKLLPLPQLQHICRRTKKRSLDKFEHHTFFRFQ